MSYPTTPSRSPHRQVWTSLSWVLIALGFAAMACSDPPGPNNIDGPDPEPEMSACGSSEDCEGEICLADRCRPCVDDSVCESDSAYGAGATCVDGVCEVCVGALGCACNNDEACEGELVCSEDVCAECGGALGCACDGDEACEGELACIGGECAVCVEGSDGCPCFGNDTCLEGLRCNVEVSACEPCPSGEEGCACGEGDVCEGELVCMEGLCVPFECQLGQEGCPCREGEDERCNEGLVCTEGDMCAACTPEFEGCPCDESDTCENDLVCDESETLCRDVLACADISCVLNQVCTEAEAGLDALCLEACVEGFDYNAETGECDRAVVINCQVGDPDSILPTCGLLNRECVELDGGAECGNCQPDFLDEDGALETCREAVQCDGLSCSDDNRVCTPHDAQNDAVCGACLMGFEERDSVCEPIPQANCQPDAELSILEGCQAQNRVCIENEQGAMCGGCEVGFGEENAQCIRRLCEDLNCRELGRECEGEPLAECGDCQEGLTPSDLEDPLSQCLEAITCDQRASAPFADVEPNDSEAEAGSVAFAGLVSGSISNPEDIDWFRFEIAEAGTELSFVTSLRGLVPLDTRLFLCDTSDPANCTFEAGNIASSANGGEGDFAALSFTFVEAGTYFVVVEAEGGGSGDYFLQIRDDELGCDPNQFCVENEGQDSACSDWPCVGEDNEPDFESALRVDQNRCVFCDLPCETNGVPRVEGETGRIWPFTLANSDRCICETEPGFYVDRGGNFTARPCDDDGDGWVRDSARVAIESDDPALSDNARCGLRSADRFVLENEYGQSFTVHSCLEGVIGAFPCETDGDCGAGRCNAGSCDCIVRDAFDLYETVRNDDQGALDDTNENDVPTYADGGGRGRRLKASELTPLTRACVSATADHNDNGLRDIVEFQGSEPLNNDPDALLFTRFGHFVELHESRFERTVGETHGRIHISEKSRCAPDFPVQIDPAEGPYWRDCTRNRDEAFDNLGEVPLSGFDFAEWSCPEPRGTCLLPPPLTDVTPDGEIPPHGLCEEGVTLPPADGVWRGMNHHSMFKCIEIADTVEDQSATPHLRTAAEMTGEARPLQANRCGVACPEGFDLMEEARGFADVSDLVLKGTTVQDGTELQMTPSRLRQVGNAWLTEPVLWNGETSFTTFFEATIEGPGGGSGLSFILHSDPAGTDALSTDIRGGGYGDITRSIAIHIDTQNNNNSDPNGNHVALHLRGFPNDHTVVEIPDFLMHNGEPFFVWVEYDGGTNLLSVFVAPSEVRPEQALFTHTFDITSQLGARVVVGLGGSTAGLPSRQAFSRWAFHTMQGPLNLREDLDCALDCEDGVCSQSSIVNDGNSDTPRLTCTAIEGEGLAVGDVRFAAVRYDNAPNDYTQGCIDEFNPVANDGQRDPWRALCPGYEDNPDAVVGSGNPGNFGRIVCGCNFNLSGNNCDLGCAGDVTCEGDECATSNLFYGGGGQGDLCDNGFCPINPDGGSGQVGFWVCGTWGSTSTEGELSHPDGWDLKGEVPRDGIRRTPMCENQDCDNGFGIR